ncbi:TolC family protein [Orrella sp. 11846]|uniref:TolC family protein n=1 Tax=Orrella sp. 11846 TaxID=3409913 RepID=UPI003B58C919
MRRTLPIRSSIRLLLCYLSLSALAILISGCATHALDRAPASPHAPWQDPKLPDSSSTSKTFSIAPVPTSNALKASAVEITKNHTPYTLTALIDLAQQNNPLTRTAWNQARQAALAVGMVEATFLPVISASVIGGHQRTSVDSPLSIGPREFTTTISGVVPALSMGWLVFDFGQRAALLEAAEQLSRASNILFNAAHQKVIWDVTTSYYQYNLRREQSKLAQDAIKQRQAIAQAARARHATGLATVLDTTFSEQLVQQAKLHLVNAQGLERNAYLDLLAKVGLSPMTELRIAPQNSSQTSANQKKQIELSQTAIEQAVAQRPDIAASYAAVQAAKANIRAVEADFMPKVFMAGMLASNQSNFRLQNLPTIQQTGHASGILMGISVPLYEGGIRNARLVGAQIRKEQADQNFDELQRDAVREIVLAQTMLESAFESEKTANQLVKTAQTAYGAAFDSYKEGLATMTMVTETANALLHARQAALDARTAVRLSSATLAFALGQLTSAQAATQNSITTFSAQHKK